MPYLRSVITIDESPLRRRVLVFVMLDDFVVLDSDVDEERATKRHKFRWVRSWLRLRNKHSTMERRGVPQHAIDAAMADIRSQIVYREDA